MKLLRNVLIGAAIISGSCAPGPAVGPPPTTVQDRHPAFSRPLVSIEFDDGWASAYSVGLPVVRSFGWTPTQYIITDTAARNGNYGAGTYMTNAQIRDWVAQGGDIGAHTVDHADLATLTMPQIEAEMDDSKTYLTGLLGRPPTLFATPYCSANNDVKLMAKQYFQDMRNCDDPINTAAAWDPYNVHSISIENTTSLSDLATILAFTKALNGWTVLTWHQIGPPLLPSDNTYTSSVDDLRAAMQLVKDSGIKVVSSQQGLNESLGLG